MRTIYPVILSGGIGSRLWPLSRGLFPKQLLSLAGERSLIQNTVQRARGREFGPPIIICNAEHRFLVAEQMREINVSPHSVVLEPSGRNTAPAAAIAALMIEKENPDCLALLMPADHIVDDYAAFKQAIEVASKAAEDNYIVTFGISPEVPETGYGYIRRGETLKEAKQIFSVDQFVEKPDAITASNYVSSGEFYWNSGIFLFRPSALVDELNVAEPELLSHCRMALELARKDLDYLRLAQAPFESCKSISIDHAIMEHTKKGAVVPVNMGWSDVGSWESLWNCSAKDEMGNRLEGDILHHSVRNSYLRSEGPLVAAVGLDEVVVVATKDAVLVSRKNASQDVKQIVRQLEDSGRQLHLTHRKVHRPWGTYEILDCGDNFQVKRITVNVGAKLSLQMHHKRAEHWIIVSGRARVTCDDKVFELEENQSTFIPLGAKHRLENVDGEPLHLIEVQSGSYLGEDDIVRFEDSYNR